MPPNYCILKNNTYLCTRNRERLILIKNECLFSSVGQSTRFVISGSLVRIRQEAQKGSYQSGQMGLTVTQLAFAFGGSNPSLPTN